MGRVDGKVALVTGAARGQGRAIAVRMAQEGAHVIAVDVCAKLESTPYPGTTPEDLAETVRQAEASGRRIVAREADTRDLAALTAVVAEGVAELGPVDIVCANAGIWSHGLIDALPERTWQEVIDVNLTGTWHTVQAAYPHLPDGASIVLTSSTLGLTGAPGTAHYGASKHGVVGIMRALAHELGPRMINVNSVHPTAVNTPMLHNDTVYGLYRPDLENPSTDDFYEPAAMMNLLPVPQIEPEDVANAVLFLASDEARFITGTTLHVDAGALTK